MSDNPIKYSYDHVLMPSKRFESDKDTEPEFFHENEHIKRDQAIGLWPEDGTR